MGNITDQKLLTKAKCFLSLHISVYPEPNGLRCMASSRIQNARFILFRTRQPAVPTPPESMLTPRLKPSTTRFEPHRVIHLAIESA